MIETNATVMVATAFMLLKLLKQPTGGKFRFDGPELIRHFFVVNPL